MIKRYSENLYLLNSLYSCLSPFTVRPPPGFECKQPANHMSGIDDPSILWSKTLDPGEHFSFILWLEWQMYQVGLTCEFCVGFLYQTVTGKFGE